MKRLTFNLLFGIVYGAPATEDFTFTNSLEDCLKFAAQFDNTCTDFANAVDFASIPTGSNSCV